MLKYAIGAVAGLLALIGAYFYGVGVGHDQRDAAIALDIARANLNIVRTVADIGRARAIVALAEQNRQQVIREITREIPTIIRADPVYRNVCVSDDGVRALDRATAAANGRSAGGSAENAPDAAPGPAHD